MSLSQLRFPAQYLEIIEAFAAQHGLSSAAFHTALGLPAGATGHADNAMDGEQFVRALRQVRALADPARPLSVQLLEMAPLTVHGVLGIVILTSPTLRAALDAALRFYPLVMPACDIQRRDEPDAVCLDVHLTEDFGDLQETVMEILLGAFNSIRHHLPDTPLWLSLYFAHPATHPLATYQGLADHAHLHFGQPHNRLRVPHTTLDLPLLTSSQTTMRQLEQQLESLIQEHHNPLAFTQRVRAHLQTQLRHGRSLAIEEMAHRLGVSSRTLGRYLAREGQTYKALVNTVRLDHAEQLLLHSRKSIRQIARAAGFCNDSSFARAFRIRKGMTPSQLREGVPADQRDAR